VIVNAFIVDPIPRT